MSRSAIGSLVLGLIASMTFGIVPEPARSAPANAGANAATAPRHNSPANAPPKAKFTIGKDTTYVTGPVDKHGYIDYATALNERLRQGVTPANNANVLFYQVFGRMPEGAPMPAEFFEWLGIPAPRRAQYYVDLFRYLRDDLKVDTAKYAEIIFDQWDRAASGPWTQVRYPHLATWLKVNEKALALVVEGTKRPQYYSPVVPHKDADGSRGLISTLLPGVQKCRELANALVMRALLRMGQGRYDEAWQDLLACHRLGRLLARGSTLIEALVGLAIDIMPSAGDVVFLGNADLDAQTIKKCLGDLQALPPMPPIADKVDLGERFMFLDLVMLLDRRGIEQLTAILDLSKDKEDEPLPKTLPAAINWDPALRTGNRWYDRLAATIRMQNRDQKAKQWAVLEKDLQKLSAKLKKMNVAKALKKGTAEERGQVLGDLLVTLLLPSIRKVEQANDRIGQVHDNLRVAFALGQYQREHGQYPKELEALAPAYLKEVPLDRFAGKALKYLPSEDGYLLYSVGVNGVDEGGRTYDDEPPGDDLRVLMPPRK
jgi:hypothetical protein